MSTFKGQNDMLTELLKSNMVKKKRHYQHKENTNTLKERLDELVKENKFDCAQLPSTDKERNSECLIFEKRNYASCHQLGKHVIYLISIKLEQFLFGGWPWNPGQAW